MSFSAKREVIPLRAKQKSSNNRGKNLPDFGQELMKAFVSFFGVPPWVCIWWKISEPKNTYVFLGWSNGNESHGRKDSNYHHLQTHSKTVVTSRIPNFHYISLHFRHFCCGVLGFFPWHQSTCHPCSAKDFAAAKPKPLEAPVMTTVFLGFRKGMALGGTKKGQLRMNGCWFWMDLDETVLVGGFNPLEKS